MRVKTSVASKRRKKRLLKQTKGFWGQRKNVYRRAKETLLRSLAFSYRDRKAKKRTMRSLWISRINAALREEGLTYSKFIHSLKVKEIDLDSQLNKLGETFLRMNKAEREVVKDLLRRSGLFDK